MELRLRIAAAALLPVAACSGEPTASTANEVGENAGSATSPANGAGFDRAVTSDAKSSSSDRRSAAEDIGDGRELARIPLQFRGTWARSVADCGVRNLNRVTVTGDAVRLFEGGGAVRDIRRDGDSLAISYLERTPADESILRAIYLALEGDGGMRVRLNGDDSPAYRRCPAAEVRDVEDSRSQASLTVPARFRGLYALDRRACEEDYTYNPAFQNVTVGAREVSFFETGGPVTDVDVAGNSIAVTLRETVGDGEFTRAIYLALNDDGTVRYRPESDAPARMYVRCAGE